VRHGLLFASALIAAAASAGPPLSLALQARQPAPLTADLPPLLPRPEVVRPFLLGFHPLVADLYWLRTIQYLGEQLQHRRPVLHLYPLVDFVTSLDPHFVDAFHLGALFLSIGGQYQQAIAIYERGIAHHPDRWELPHDLGRLYFLELKDDARALQYWLVADRLPGRPHYLPRFIARLYAKTGKLETALELWQQMAQNSHSEWVQQRAKIEIQKLLAEKQRQRRTASPRVR